MLPRLLVNDFSVDVLHLILVGDHSPKILKSSSSSPTIASLVRLS